MKQRDLPALKSVSSLALPESNGSAVDLCRTDNRLYISNSGPGTLTILDPNSKDTIATIPGLPDIQSFIVVEQYGTGFAALRSEKAIAVIDLATRKVQARIALGHSPVILHYATMSDIVYVGSQDGSGTLIDPKKARVIGTLTLGGSPAQVWEDFSSGDIYQAE